MGVWKMGGMKIYRMSTPFHPFETSMITIDAELHGEPDFQGPGARKTKFGQKTNFQFFWHPHLCNRILIPLIHPGLMTLANFQLAGNLLEFMYISFYSMKNPGYEKHPSKLPFPLSLPPPPSPLRPPPPPRPPVRPSAHPGRPPTRGGARGGGKGIFEG